MRQRSRFIVFLLASLVWVASCAGEPESSASETSAPEPTAEASATRAAELETSEPDEEAPTPEPLPLPEYPADLTAEDTAENAILAAEYFIELMNYIQSTGDVEPFEEVAAESCESCRRFIERVTALYADGSFSVGHHIQIEKPFAERTKDDLAWVVVSDWKVSDGFRFKTNSGEKTEVEGTRFEKHRVGVQPINEQWKILTFAKASAE